jgi:hypothetical protein
MTYIQFDDVNAKDKAPNNFCFALVDSQNKRWRTVFSCSTKYEYESWKTQTQMTMDLGMYFLLLFSAGFL